MANASGGWKRSRRGWSAALAWVLVFSLVLSPLPLAGAPVAEGAIAVPAAETQTESPGDALIVSWAQADIEGERTVLLQWLAAYRHFIYLPLTIRGGTQSAAGASANATAGAAPVATSAVDATTDGYSIWRRLSGDADWGFLETVSPVTTPDDLVTVLGQDLVDQLCLDLRADPDDPALTLKQLFERLRRPGPREDAAGAILPGGPGDGNIVPRSWGAGE